MEDILLKEGSKKTSAVFATRGRAGSRRWIDILINTTLVLTVGIGILSYRVPIFSHYLYTTQSIHDFGIVKEGTNIQHVFTVWNLHPWPVTVLAVHSTCGCTKAMTEQNLPVRLLPLQAVSVAAALNVEGKGEVEQPVWVVTSDNAVGTPVLLRGTVL